VDDGLLIMLAVTCDQQQCSAVGLRPVMHIVLRPSKGPYTRHVRPSCCDTARSAILGTAWLLVIYGLNDFRHRLLSPFFVSLVAYWPLHWQSVRHARPGHLHLCRLRPGDAHARVSDGVICLAALRQLHSTRHLVSTTIFQSLVAALW